MLEEGEKLVPGFKDMRVLRAWAGVRPLYQEATVDDTRDVTRAFVLLDHEKRDGLCNFITITGGKWTTYRKMAEVTVDLVCEKLGHRPDPAGLIWKSCLSHRIWRINLPSQDISNRETALRKLKSRKPMAI